MATHGDMPISVVENFILVAASTSRYLSQQSGTCRPDRLPLPGIQVLREKNECWMSWNP
jgi:hypothetical protein